jgi:hypothetical protein
MELPYRKDRRYLTGVDWTVNLFHHATSLETGVGNLSQIVLELEGSLSLATLEEALAEAFRRFPLMAGQPARDWLNLAPYWSYPASPDPARRPWRIRETRVSAGTGFDTLLGLLSVPVNTPLASETEHLVLTIVRDGSLRTWLGMTFDHRLFDARGAETFLAMLQEISAPATAANPIPAAITEPAHLDNWVEKFKSGQQVNRKFMELRRKPIAYLQRLPRRHLRPYHFHVYRCSEAESAAFAEAADNEAGPLMLMPYALAMAIEILHPVFQARRIPGQEYLIPVSLDARTLGKKWDEVFFNHLSFLFFEMPVAQAGNRPALLDLTIQQFYNQIRSGFPKAVANANMLMRIAPLGLMRRIASLPLRGENGSFCFAYVGTSALNACPDFLGLPILNLFHMPRVPPPPGIGIFLNQYRGRYNVTFTHLDGMLTDDEARAIIERIRERMALPEKKP